MSCKMLAVGLSFSFACGVLTSADTVPGDETKVAVRADNLGRTNDAANTDALGEATPPDSATFYLDVALLSDIGLRILAQGQIDELIEWKPISFPIDGRGELRIREDADGVMRAVAGQVPMSGALLLVGAAQRVIAGNIVVEVRPDGTWMVNHTLTQSGGMREVFSLSSVLVDHDRVSGDVRVTGELTVTDSLAHDLGLPDIDGITVGTLVLDLPASGIDRSGVPTDDGRTIDSGTASAAIGPDIVIADLQGVVRLGREGDITGFSVGTTACNLGDEPANWISYTNEHPVIIMNMYRLHDDGFEQIGMSWVKHGFYAVSQYVCSSECDPLSTDGSQLGVLCSDPYSATLNGVQTNMSPRHEVNAHTGYFPYPWEGWETQPVQNDVDRRLQVHDADLDSTVNEGATYFVQGHYVTADDTLYGNNDNNASYRRVDVNDLSNGVYNVTVNAAWPTQREQPAVRAWQDNDDTVVETDIRVPGEGLFMLATKTTDLGNGYWRYAYALQNLNSDRSARSFSIPVGAGIDVENMRFHDVDYHSGEPYDLTDWALALSGTAITWSTGHYEVNPFANALRFSTLYSFYFDAKSPPEPTTATIELFKPGQPLVTTGTTVGPSLTIEDCNGNGILDTVDILNNTSLDCDANDVPDECQLDCNHNMTPDTCDIAAGISDDCNQNSVPDECETDCNLNGIPDDCDLATGNSADCNYNTVPDECDPDCDNDGIPSDCDMEEDSDGDSILDCVDICPFTTPHGGCDCSEEVCCEVVGFPPCTFVVFPWICVEFYNGVPECTPEGICREGCLIFDFDRDGDIDLRDAQAMQIGFSGPADLPGFTPPPDTYLNVLDLDLDQDIDLDDYMSMQQRFGGP